jgi:transcription termination factor Rho
VLNPLNTVDSMELLIDKIKETQSNSEFLASMNS